MNLSIIIPVYNEEESLKELSAWIERVMNENNLSYNVANNSIKILFVKKNIYYEKFSWNLH